MTTTTVVKTPVDKLKIALSAESVREQFQNALKENSGAFVASIIDLVASDSKLQQCNPNAVIMECLKAAILGLPINKQLGFAYIIPYNIKGILTPQFQPGYKTYVQLAMRTGQYRFLNASVIVEGYTVSEDILTGKVTITGEPVGEKAIGYCAYLELLNGFSKARYMTVAEVLSHAKRYSKNFKSDDSKWKTDFDAMAQKTVLKQLLSKYGILSIEMQNVIVNEERDIEAEVGREIEVYANKEEIAILTSAE